jgi:hypothetical protein
MNCSELGSLSLLLLSLEASVVGAIGSLHPHSNSSALMIGSSLHGLALILFVLLADGFRQRVWTWRRA